MATGLFDYATTLRTTADVKKAANQYELRAARYGAFDALNYFTSLNPRVALTKKQTGITGGELVEIINHVTTGSLSNDQIDTIAHKLDQFNGGKIGTQNAANTLRGLKKEERSPSIQIHTPIDDEAEHAFRKPTTSVSPIPELVYDDRPRKTDAEIDEFLENMKGSASSNMNEHIGESKIADDKRVSNDVRSKIDRLVKDISNYPEVFALASLENYENTYSGPSKHSAFVGRLNDAHRATFQVTKWLDELNGLIEVAQRQIRAASAPPSMTALERGSYV